MILENQSLKLNEYDSSSFITKKQLAKILDNSIEYRDELLKIFKYDENITEVLKIGNAKQLLNSINILDSQCEKIDIISKIRDVQLYKLLDEEKAIFEIFSIKENYIIKHNKSDLLLAETRYSAKSDILDYYNFSKFANYCRDNVYEDLVNVIKEYLKKKNVSNDEEKKLRLIHNKESNEFYLRAITSSQDYKNFGINFSIFVALMSLGKYVEDKNNEIFIDNYLVNESNLYVSFTFSNKRVINKNLSLSFSLILENDEVKRSAVSFNGIFKLNYSDKDKKSEIFLRPNGIKKDDKNFPVDLLNYQHRGTVENVFEKIQELPTLIEFFITQVSEDAEKISNIKHPDDIRKLISNKVKYSKKPEFKVYKDKIFNKLMSINVDNTFKLFELLREVEELFEHDDVISLNFWRTKLYESLIERK